MSLIAHKAPVHHSLLQVVLCAGVPYQAAFGNVAQTFLVVIVFQWWRYVVVAAVFHALLWWYTGDDPNRLYKLWRYCTYAPYYRPG